MEEVVRESMEIFRYSLIAAEYYKKGYEQHKKEMMDIIKRKYHLVDVDEYCEGISKELNRK